MKDSLAPVFTAWPKFITAKERLAGASMNQNILVLQVQTIKDFFYAYFKV